MMNENKRNCITFQIKISISFLGEGRVIPDSDRDEVLGKMSSSVLLRKMIFEQRYHRDLNIQGKIISFGEKNARLSRLEGHQGARCEWGVRGGFAEER